MIRPDDEDRLFVARWNVLVSSLLIEPSVKLVAMQAAQYGLADGENVYPGNERIARQTGLTEKTVREAWHFMRGAGMAIRDARSAWTGDRRTADLYELTIPDDWYSMALLGPHARKFTCQQCRKMFNPPPCNVFLTDKAGHPAIDKGTGNRQVRWYLCRATFCPDPRRGPGCFADWKRAGGKWGDGAWAMFKKARNDDW
jgi:hypothetical protein